MASARPQLENIASLALTSSILVTLPASKINIGSQFYSTQPLTCSIAVVGVGGLEAAVVNNTTYYVYAVAPGGVPGLIASTSSSGPSAYEPYKLIGQFRTGVAQISGVFTYGSKELINPTVQTFTSGSGTYTTPVNPSPTRIRVRMVGGGGGGSGSGTSGSAGSGAAGGNSTFGAIIANGGGGGFANNIGSTAGNPGSYTIPPGVLGFGVSGGTGQGVSLITLGVSGSPGGNSALGGGGKGGYSFGSPEGGIAGSANTGGGGGGAGPANSSAFNGSGGAAGSYVDVIINLPASSYSYSVGTGGAGGTAGTSGATGGAGGAGIIIVEEFYQ